MTILPDYFAHDLADRCVIHINIYVINVENSAWRVAVSAVIPAGVFLRFKRQVDRQSQLKLRAVNILVAHLVLWDSEVKKTPRAAHDVGLADQEYAIGDGRLIARDLLEDLIDETEY